MLQAVAEHYKFDLEAPFQNLSKEAQKVIQVQARLKLLLITAMTVAI